MWIRTADGNLWLAPEQAGTGLSWGYNGSGPLALAILLGDINAAAPRGYRYPQSPGLLAARRKPGAPDARFTRADLAAAAAANPADRPVTGATIPAMLASADFHQRDTCGRIPGTRAAQGWLYDQRDRLEARRADLAGWSRDGVNTWAVRARGIGRTLST